MDPPEGRVRKYEAEVKRARADILELQGLREQDRAEMDGLREDLAVCNAGYDAEREEKAAVEAARDEASKQLEFLEAELEGVRAEESRPRPTAKVKTEELSDLTSARDELDDEVRRLKELSNAREIECTKLRSQLSELREQHSVALERRAAIPGGVGATGGARGKTGGSADVAAAMSEADKLRKWQDWAKSSEVTSLQSELEVVKQERDMLQRDLQSRLAEMRRVTQQNEEWGGRQGAARGSLRQGGEAREGGGGARGARALLGRGSKTRPSRRSTCNDGSSTQVAAMDAVKTSSRKFDHGAHEESVHRQLDALLGKTSRSACSAAPRNTGRDGGGETRRGGGGMATGERELEARVTQQAKFPANNKKFSKALSTGRRRHGAKKRSRRARTVDLT